MARYPLYMNGHVAACSINLKGDDARSLMDFAITGDQIGYWESLYHLAAIQLRTFDIPKIEIVMPIVENPEEHQIVFKDFDRARDPHLGIKSHAALADRLYKEYNKTL